VAPRGGAAAEPTREVEKMRPRLRRLLSAMTVLALASAFVPATALAAPTTPARRVSWNPISGYPKDLYDAGDDAVSGARDVTAKIGAPLGMHGYGMPIFYYCTSKYLVMAINKPDGLTYFNFRIHTFTSHLYDTTIIY
jgi:hypothetical protein